MADAKQIGEVLPFGKYLLDAEIARGGMARVFRARLRGLGGFEKILVVKQILPELGQDPRFIDMFVREANTLVQMNHPNIVPVYELGVIDGVYFLAMEHVEGATLADMISFAGPLSPELVVHLGVQICDALQYAHEKFGVVHRDVTPRNIIVDASGHARLLDFGIAAPAEGTETNEIFGSHGYMAKEQIRGDKLTPAADVFALGASLFEAFTGKPAFRRENAAASQAAVLVDEGPFFGTVSTVPKDLRPVLERTLSREVNERPHVTHELGKKLRTWLSGTHPEGVAVALGELAEKTRNAPAKKAQVAALQTPTTHGREPSGLVRTWATSPALDALLSGEPNAPMKERASDAGVADGGTQRMASRVVAPKEQIVVPATAARRPFRKGYVVAASLVAALVVVLSVLGTQRTPTPRPSVPASRPPRVTELQHATETRPNPVSVVAQDAGNANSAQAEVVATEAPASLNVNAVPWAEVRLDGRLLGNTPRRQLSVTPGNHTLVLSCPPLDRRTSVSLRAVSGRTLQVLANLTSDPPEVTVR